MRLWIPMEFWHLRVMMTKDYPIGQRRVHIELHVPFSPKTLLTSEHS